MNKNVEIASKVYYYALVYPGKYNEYSVDRELSNNAKYKNRVKRAIQEIKLEERGFLKIVRKRGNGRDENILYGEIDPLISTIGEKTKLTDFDRYVLKDKFNSQFFRYLLRTHESYFLVDLSSGIIKKILNMFELLFIIFDDNGMLTKISRRIKTEKQYKEAENKIRQKIRHMIENKPESVELSIAGDLLVFFIFPEELLKKIKGISELGELCNAFKELSSTISNTPNLSIEKIYDDL